jgi:hypothetical protein
MKRSGPLRERLALRALRLGAVLWRLCERLGIDLVGATEGPPLPDPARRKEFDELIAAAVDGDGVIDASALDYPVHELLTHLVTEHGMLLHGSNDATLELIEPRPAHDFGTEIHAVVACADGIWPIFYAVVARDRVDGMFNGCVHIGRPPRLRRFYLFALAGADPAAPTSWTRGAVYALPRNGFRREWGTEWVSPYPARPVLRVLVGPEDFPLRDAVVAASPGEGFRSIRRRLRAARDARATPPAAAHELEAPTFRTVLLSGLPQFLREGFLPIGAFYVGLRLGDLTVGIAAAAAVSAAVYVLERRAGRDGLLVRLSLAFVAVQSAIGLISNSTTVYLAQPVLANAAWGLAFLGSAMLRRPLAGAFACAWYPFPRWFREADSFKRVFGVESVVWGIYFLGRAALRLAVLLYGDVESFLIVTIATGTPAMLVLTVWSIRYAIRRLSADEGPSPVEAGTRSFPAARAGSDQAMEKVQPVP